MGGPPVSFILDAHLVNELDGVEVDPPNNVILNPTVFSRDVVQELEIQLDYPAARDGVTHARMWRNGTLMADHEFRYVDTTTMINYAVRHAWANFNNTYGGSGLLPPNDIILYIGEIYVAGGAAREGEMPLEWVLELEGGGTTIPAGDTGTVIATLVDGNGLRIDHYPGWGAPDFEIAVTNGATLGTLSADGPGRLRRHRLWRAHPDAC